MQHQLTKTEIANALVLLGEGTTKHFSNLPIIMFEEKMSTPAELTARCNALAQFRFDVNAARARLEEALTRENAAEGALGAFFVGYSDYVRVACNNNPVLLKDFGIAPRKSPSPLTTEQMLVAIEKRDATRKARGTMGPRQRLEIHGDVTGVEVTPITGSAAPPAAEKKEVTSQP